MHVGVPKEIKVHEYRVGLTPPSVAELTAAGHSVTVETGAGGGIDFTDRDYVAAGAVIAPTAAAVFAAADMIAAVFESLRSNFAWPWWLAALPLPWLVRRFWPAASTAAPALRVPYGDRISTIGGQIGRARSRGPGVLPWLAWALSIDEWDPTWAEEVRRAQVARANRAGAQDGLLRGHGRRQTAGDRRL